MSAQLIGIGVALVILVGAAFAIWLAGRKYEQAQRNQDNANASERVSEAIANGPRNRSDLADRLRNGGGL